MKPISKILLLFFLAAIWTLTACIPQPTAQPLPTIDMEALRAEIVSTVVAQITADAPKETATSAPTATVEPPALSPTADKPLSTLAPLSTFTASPLTTRYPTWTPTLYTDRASLSLQSLVDGTHLTRGQDFDVTWTIKNTGFRPWNDEFYALYLSGVKPYHFEHKMLTPVNQGDEISVTANYIAPLEPGYYVTQWALMNDDAVKFFRFNFVFYVD